MMMKPMPEMNHATHELIRKRWSPRAFSSQPVEKETILTLFEAARWAASCMNEQPWRFLYATKSEPESYQRLFDCLTQSNQVWCITAPVLVMTFARVNFERNNQPNRWAFHDVGLAIGNLTTQASALNLYVHNMAGFSLEKARASFNLSSDFEPVTMIAFGYLGDPDQLPGELKTRELSQQQRKPLEELFV